MKKFLVLSAVALFPLMGCGGGEEKAPKKEGAPAKKEDKAAPAPAKPAAPAPGAPAAPPAH